METSSSQETPLQKPSERLLALEAELGQLGLADEKIALLLAFMRSSLEGRPCFKDFWEAKNRCASLFRDKVSPALRAKLWQEYQELAGEAKALRERLDEESGFAIEQIELALVALEGEITSVDERLPTVSFFVWPEGRGPLAEKSNLYTAWHNEFYLLDTLIDKVVELRKEILKTDMRLRFKHRFLDRLSSAGDALFPRRKEVVSKIGADFLAEVTALTSKGLSKEELKFLQALMRGLVLGPQVGNEIRKALSGSWDEVSKQETLFQAEREKQNEQLQKNAAVVRDKIKVLEAKCALPTCTQEEGRKIASDIASFMRGIDLGREELRLLKDEIEKAQAPLRERARQEEEEKIRLTQAAERQRREKIELLKRGLEEAMASIDTLTLQELAEKREECNRQMGVLGLTPFEREGITALFKELRDKMLAHQEEKAKTLTEEERESVEALLALLKERKEQRAEIKQVLEEYRRALSGSGFDFEKALHYQELLATEKERLERITVAIEELEDRLADLEG